MKITKNFDLREFVSPTVWNRFGENSKWFVNPWCYEFAQFIKEFLSQHYGEEVVITINDWHYGGQRKWSCHRTYQYINKQVKDGKKVATLSQHVGGQANAIDCLFIKKNNGEVISSDDARQLILDNESLMMSHGLTSMEGSKWAPTWCHLDNRPTGKDHIVIFGA